MAEIFLGDWLFGADRTNSVEDIVDNIIIIPQRGGGVWGGCSRVKLGVLEPYTVA